MSVVAAKSGMQARAKCLQSLFLPIRPNDPVWPDNLGQVGALRGNAACRCAPIEPVQYLPRRHREHSRISGIQFVHFSGVLSFVGEQLIELTFKASQHSKLDCKLIVVAKTHLEELAPGAFRKHLTALLPRT